MKLELTQVHKWSKADQAIVADGPMNCTCITDTNKATFQSHSWGSRAIATAKQEDQREKGWQQGRAGKTEEESTGMDMVNFGET